MSDVHISERWISKTFEARILGNVVIFKDFHILPHYSANASYRSDYEKILFNNCIKVHQRYTLICNVRGNSFIFSNFLVIVMSTNHFQKIISVNLD